MNRAGLYVRRIRSKSPISQRFTISASAEATQNEVIDKLKNHVANASARTRNKTLCMNGVAIFSSKEFTSWVEDDHFMSAFLETLFKPRSTGLISRPNLHVLSGITDGLDPLHQSSEPRSGFAVLCGPVKNILPGLWRNESFAGTGPDAAACVSFVTNPLNGNTGALEVTLPLANTVFQNGRRSSLYASRWGVSNEGSVTLRRKYAKIKQQIEAKGDFVDHTQSMIPLLPITPPRRILAGLGNIVRQVEIDGSATPASKELEAIIPKIFEERSQDGRISPGPISVWCWVIPPHVMEAIEFDDLDLFKAGSSQFETHTIMNSNAVFSKFLSSGCRLHKILSGGGGWGLKQGLLSLDPETKFSLPGQDDDMEMFIRSFKERNSAEPTSGLATPGSFLLFCIEPQVSIIAAQRFTEKALQFGVAPNVDYTPSPGSLLRPVEVIDGSFRVSSTTGLYLRAIPARTGVGSDSENEDTSQDSFTTKIDVPESYICFQ